MTLKYRIINTVTQKIKFAGTGLDSWFSNIEDARKLTDYSNNETIYEYCNKTGDKLWEVL